MSQDGDNYIHFTVGLLKNSFAMNALLQDAMRYHMIDQPGKLIALRLTEYYEAIARGGLPENATAPAPTSTAPANRERKAGTNGSTPAHAAAPSSEDEDFDGLVGTSPTVSQNAQAAADYWAPL